MSSIRHIYFALMGFILILALPSYLLIPVQMRLLAR